MAVIFIGVASSAQGAVVINAVETGGDVVFTYSGTINQGGWELIGNAVDFAQINPDRSVFVGPTPAVTSARFRVHPNNPTGLQGPDNFGPGTLLVNATSGTGDIFGLSFDEELLVVPSGYVRNTQISGTSTYSGQTFASLGMAPDSYTWTWNTLPFMPGSDSVTLNVVPIPAAAWLLGSGLVALGAIARRRKQTA